LSETTEPDGSFRRVWLLTLAHTAVDFYMLMAPPLYAVFKTRFGLTVFQTSFLPSFASVVGAIAQPFMGYFSDGRNRLILAGLGVLICTLFVSSIGFAPTVYVLAAFLVCAALGSSLFHPTAGGLVTSFLPGRSNLTMAIFLTGGTFGMSLGPITATQIVERYGIGHMWICVFPGLIVFSLLYLTGRTQRALTDSPSGGISLSALREKEMRPLWTLYGISVLRSMTHTGYVSFIALLGASRGWPTGKIGWVLSGYLISNTLGRICGGYLADRVSARRLLAFSNATSGACHIAFCFATGEFTIPTFFLAGFLFDLGITTNIVLAQEIMPKNTSTATGVVMGFSWGTAGLMMPLVGRLAEYASLSIALATVSAFLLPAALLVVALPSAASREGTG
jgi:FSR family fosmidomycin resistance protein-like MFS transporter